MLNDESLSDYGFTKEDGGGGTGWWERAEEDGFTVVINDGMHGIPTEPDELVVVMEGHPDEDGEIPIAIDLDNRVTYGDLLQAMRDNYASDDPFELPSLIWDKFGKRTNDLPPRRRHKPDARFVIMFRRGGTKNTTWHATLKMTLAEATEALKKEIRAGRTDSYIEEVKES